MTYPRCLAKPVFPVLILLPNEFEPRNNTKRGGCSCFRGQFLSIFCFWNFNHEIARTEQIRGCSRFQFSRNRCLKKSIPYRRPVTPSWIGRAQTHPALLFNHDPST